MEASKKAMKRTREAKKPKTRASKNAKEKMEKPKTPRNADSQGAIVEKNRRKKMKDLCASLQALLPPPPPTTAETKEKMVVLSTLDRSTNYVKFLKAGNEQLKRKRDELKEDLVMADVQVNEYDSVLEVNLVTGLNKGHILHKILKILEEEGARVMTANCSRLTDKIVYTVVSQAFYPRIGIATSRVHERLKVLSGMSTLPLPAGQPGQSSSSPK